MQCSIEQVIAGFAIACVGAVFAKMYDDSLSDLVRRESIFLFMFRIVARGFFSVVAAFIITAIFNMDCFVYMAMSGFFGFIGNEQTLELVKHKGFKKETEEEHMEILKNTNFSLQNINIPCKYLYEDERHQGYITALSLTDFTLRNGFIDLKSLSERVTVDFSNSSLPLDEQFSCSIKGNSNDYLILNFPELTELQRCELTEWIIYKAIAIVNKMS